MNSGSEKKGRDQIPFNKKRTRQENENKMCTGRTLVLKISENKHVLFFIKKKNDN